MNFNSINFIISGLVISICLNSNVFAFRTYKCEENYHLFHKWYSEESKIFLIKNENILNLFASNQNLSDQLKVDVKEDDFRSFCRFYNLNADKNVTYSPCTDQRYDVYSCFRRFILLLNENLNVAIEKFIEFGHSNYVRNELNQSLICNHTLNEHTFSIKDYFEKNCYICLKGLASTANNCKFEYSNTITQKCCLVGNLLNSTLSLNKLNSQFSNLNNIYNLNNELIAGKYTNLMENLKASSKQLICLGEKSQEDCICPKGYFKSDKDCIDQDECSDVNASYCTHLDNDLSRKYNRNATNSICVNTFGKFTCVRINCPTNYELKNNKCYYNDRLYYRFNTEERFFKPKVIAFDFLSLPKNVFIENGKLELFRIDSIVNNAEYNYKIHKVNSIYRNVNEINLPYILNEDLNRDEAELIDYFTLENSNETNQAILYLKNEIKSSIEAQVILLASWHSNDKKAFGITKVVLNVYVTN